MRDEKGRRGQEGAKHLKSRTPQPATDLLCMNARCKQYHFRTGNLLLTSYFATICNDIVSLWAKRRNNYGAVDIMLHCTQYELETVIGFHLENLETRHMRPQICPMPAYSARGLYTR